MNLSGPACFTAFAFFVIAAPAGAVDDNQAFVEALRKQGYHELALEYLAGADERALTSDAFRKRLPYERAVTRLDASRKIKNSAERAETLDAAAEDVKRFAAASSGDRRLAAEAESRLASAYLGAAQTELARAKPLRDGDRRGDAEPMLVAAQGAFDKARGSYAAAEKLYREEYDQLKSASQAGDGLVELRGLYAQMQMLGARTLHQKTEAFEPGSREHKSLNEQAAKDLSAFYEKYSKFLLGLYAHLYEGECYLALKQYKLAAGCFEDLVIQPDEDPAFRRLITLAHASLAEVRIAEGNHEKAAEEGGRWYESLRNDETSGPDALMLGYQLARATIVQAEALEGAKQRQLFSDARGWLRPAAQSPNKHQADARQALQLVNRVLGASDRSLDNFKEAYQAARDAVTSLSEARVAVRIAEKNNPSATGDFEAEAEDSRRRALAAIGAAIALTDDTTPIAQVNEIRSQLAFLLWEAGDYLQAAAVGEFLATRYPNDPSAEQAANLAVASLQKLYQQSEGADRFASAQLISLTEAIIKTWPGTKTASGAASVLVSLALRDSRIEDAQRIISTVDSANRATLELQLAAAVWEKATRSLLNADDTNRREAEQDKAKAAALLESAYEQGRELRPVGAPLTTAALYLAQSRLDAGKPADAIKVLEDKEVGPLSLLAKRSEATSRPGYASEAYKLALQTYVSVSPPRTGDALKTMKRLEQAVRSDGGDAASQRSKLTRVYFGLGVKLQRQIADLTSRNKTKQAQQLGGAFAAFLASLSEQSADADWTVRQWIGQTYLQLADGLTANSKNKSNPEADAYRKQASGVFQTMLDRAKEEPSFAPKPNSVLAVRLQLGKAQRATGEYAAAYDTFGAILAERQALLEVQTEAAYTLQAWGAAEDTAKLTLATRGDRLDRKTKKNLVWGWSKLSKVATQAARRNPKYKDLFYESWQNVATCKYLAAEKATGADREQQLASARKTIRSMMRNYSEKMSDGRKKEFDQLAKRIQKLEGAKQVGLEEFLTK